MDSKLNLLCRSCGECCCQQCDGPDMTPKEMGVAIEHIVPIGRMPDIARMLLEALPPSDYIDGTCPFLELKQGKYGCVIYPVRPTGCSGYECEIYRLVKEGRMELEEALTKIPKSLARCRDSKEDFNSRFKPLGGVRPRKKD